jgi:hypothetical protein
MHSKGMQLASFRHGHSKHPKPEHSGPGPNVEQQGESGQESLPTIQQSQERQLLQPSCLLLDRLHSAIFPPDPSLLQHDRRQDEQGHYRCFRQLAMEGRVGLPGRQHDVPLHSLAENKVPLLIQGQWRQ